MQLTLRKNCSNSIVFVVALTFTCFSSNVGKANDVNYWHKPMRDTIKIREDSLFGIKGSSINPVLIKPTRLLPIVSLQQQLKGNNTGVYVNEKSGEPGTKQYLFMRGISRPVTSETEVYKNQPLIVLDGIPLIGEHPFAYIVQNYDLERIGPVNNIFSSINLDVVESIEVLKDVAATALYGPNAANGAIVITSKPQIRNKSNRIAINAYTGAVARPQVTTINGTYENAFRKQFYDLYTSNGKYQDGDQYPIYLSDSLNVDYFGNSNWSDRYYNNGMVYNLNANLAGGNPRANFQFNGGLAKDQGVVEETKFQKYFASFGLNLLPVKWLTFSTQININKYKRDRNKNLRDRFAQMAYFPDLTAPLAPNKEIYGAYLDNYNQGFDNNNSNVIQAFGRLKFDFGNFHFITEAKVDYNEGYRDQFYNSKLMEGNSFASNYYGFNQRSVVDNKAYYNLRLDENQTIKLMGGASFQWETYKYNYGYAYKGINDFIKVNLIDGGLNPTSFPRELVFKYLDRIKHNLVSFYGSGSYQYKNLFEASVVLRNDGSSNAQPTNRWLFTPAASASWSIKNTYLAANQSVEDFKLRLSAGRIGLLNIYDEYAQGPNYTSQIGFTGNQTVAGYNAISVLIRPYQSGWVGYDLPWAYNDQVNLGVDYKAKKLDFFASLDVYLKNTKNQLMNIPAYNEFGYTSKYESGMNVQNKGVELTMGLTPVKTEDFKWTSSLNVSHNKNTLKALPGGLDQLIVGNTLLQVGKPLDQFWVWKNNGIYETNEQIPQGLDFRGIAIHPGDPIWEDTNHDNKIDDSDRVLMGNKLPKVFGNWFNTLQFKKWDLGINLYYNLGKKAINQEMANRFDFINQEGAKSIDAIKEITYWEKRGDYSKYPIYNPWSSVIPYLPNQDLFLENASFLKLRSLTLGYNFTDIINGPNRKKKKISNAYVYVTGNNLLTISSYSGRDPEIIDYSGYDKGQGMMIPKIYTIGLKVDF